MSRKARKWWFGSASLLTLLGVAAFVVLSLPCDEVREPPAPIPIVVVDPGTLAGVEAVVISHDHYDHLDMATVRQADPWWKSVR